MSDNPYKNTLGALKGKEITLHRSDHAPDVKGELVKIGKDGCTIKQPDADEATMIFVAYANIRGVASKDWNFETIS